MKNLLVSIIIPTYNRPCYLKRAIDSVLNQTYEPIEVIVVDDNNPESESRKETEHVMQEYANNPVVQYIKHEKNKNGSAARNTGAKFARGYYFCFLDDDDEFLPNKIESQLKCLNSKSDDYQICYSNYYRKNSKGKIVDVSRENREGFLCIECLKRNIFIQAGSNLLISRKAFSSINGFDETFRRNQDLEFLVRLNSLYKIAYCDEVGLIVNIGDHSNTNIDYDNLTKQFIDKFKNKIDEFPKNIQNDIYYFLFLQVYRFYFFRRNFKKAYQIRKQKNIKIKSIIKYFAYCIKRKITKKIYGYICENI